MKPTKLFIGVAVMSVLVGLVWLQPAQAFPVSTNLGTAARPQPTPIPGVPVAPPRLERLETELLQQINAARAMHGAGALVLDRALTVVARMRSADMLTRHYFAHITPDGRDVYGMLDALGVRAHYAGENLARNNWNDRNSAAHVITGFLNSTPHRLNMLNPKYTRVGIGAVIGPDGMKIYTVLFAGD